MQRRAKEKNIVHLKRINERFSVVMYMWLNVNAFIGMQLMRSIKIQQACNRRIENGTFD